MGIIKNFFKNAFNDMKESAKAQHEVDKANFQAAKAEAKANWEEAKAMSNPQFFKESQQKKYDEMIAEANDRIAATQERINNAKKGEINE
ncbi:MAG: hypothetical protein II196_05245 [Spirochaetales bacterium]|nr:hypothetical protein [Spirochaetales bacterium]